MRQFLLVVCSLWWGFTYAQTSSHAIDLKKSAKQDQEDDWAKNAFNEGYNKQEYQKYDGEIKQNNASEFILGKIVLMVGNADSVLRVVISNRLLDPRLFEIDPQVADTLMLSDLKELSFSSIAPTDKRFRFSCLRKNQNTPTIYFIELSNPKAKNHTNLSTFIKGASLTFFTEAWTQL